MNEIPVEVHWGNRDPAEFANQTLYQRGKDVMMDWQFDSFDTGKNMWMDSNGLDMHAKKLW